MFYYVYKITNQINGKIYIGKHQCKSLNNNYMGSGKYLKNAIVKYGLENFTKEILHVFDNEQDMNAKEKELVTEEFVQKDTNYNIVTGGHGSWYSINKDGSFNGRKHSEETKDKIRKAITGRTWKCKPMSDEGRLNISKSLIGKQNSESSKLKMRQYMWITDGFNSKKIKNTCTIPEGWYKGRTVK